MRRGRSLTFKRKRREWLYGVGRKLGNGVRLMNESTSNCLFETREICHGSRWGISEEKLGGKKCMHSIFCPVRNNCFPIISVESLSQNTERERERESFRRFSFKRFFRFPRLSRNFLGKLNTLFIGERTESVGRARASSKKALSPFSFANFPNAIQDKLVKLSKPIRRFFSRGKLGLS